MTVGFIIEYRNPGNITWKARQIGAVAGFVVGYLATQVWKKVSPGTSGTMTEGIVCAAIGLLVVYVVTAVARNLITRCVRPSHGN